MKLFNMKCFSMKICDFMHIASQLCISELAQLGLRYVISQLEFHHADKILENSIQYSLQKLCLHACMHIAKYIATQESYASYSYIP